MFAINTLLYVNEFESPTNKPNTLCYTHKWLLRQNLMKISQIHHLCLFTMSEIWTNEHKHLHVSNPPLWFFKIWHLKRKIKDVLLLQDDKHVTKIFYQRLVGVHHSHVCYDSFKLKNDNLTRAKHAINAPPISKGLTQLYAKVSIVHPRKTVQE